MSDLARQKVQLFKEWVEHFRSPTGDTNRTLEAQIRILEQLERFLDGDKVMEDLLETWISKS
jgi:hypothetical protein